MNGIQRFVQPSPQHFFLFGPRGTGKTTWLHQEYDGAIRLDLLDSLVYRTYAGRPERLADLVAARGGKKVIIIDEIQRIPEMLHVVHKLIEEIEGIQFVLTGSSARKLRLAGVDLLGGRAVVRRMHPFIAAELQDRFNLSEALEFGLVPLVWAADDRSDKLKSYIQLYLEQEIKAEGIVRNLDQFVRFLEAIAFSHANVLNSADVARECEVKRTTVAGYIQILEDLLITFHVPVFSKRAKRQLVSHVKFYLFDCGVFRALRPAGPIDRPQEIDGQALEGLVAQHLRAWIDYGAMDARMYFWRTRAGSEVDFVVYGKDCFHAIEVKCSIRIRPEDLTALRSFKEDYPESTLLLLYRGKETVMQQGILCAPVDSFLRQVIPGRPLPAPGSIE